MTSDEKALIALLVAAFLLSKRDIKDMAAAILVGRIASMKASYAQASDTVGASTDWEPSDDLQSQASDISEQDADSIAATYEADLEVQATGFVTAWMAENGSLDGCEVAARSELATWATDRSTWKSEQIADYSCSSGANTGTNEWIDDLIDEDIDLPDDISLDDIEIEVQPSESSHDECEDYAGNRYDIDEDVPEFPIHTSCIHRKVIVIK